MSLCGPELLVYWVTCCGVTGQVTRVRTDRLRDDYVIEVERMRKTGVGHGTMPYYRRNPLVAGGHKCPFVDPVGYFNFILFIFLIKLFHKSNWNISHN